MCCQQLRTGSVWAGPIAQGMASVSHWFKYDSRLVRLRLACEALGCGLGGRRRSIGRLCGRPLVITLALPRNAAAMLPSACQLAPAHAAQLTHRLQPACLLVYGWQTRLCTAVHRAASHFRCIALVPAALTVNPVLPSKMTSSACYLSAPPSCLAAASHIRCRVLLPSLLLSSHPG